MKIVSADITGSLIVNGVDVTTNVVSSSIFSGSIAGRVTSLEQFSASLDATFATDASVSASILVLSQSVQNSQAALSSSYALTSGSIAGRVTLIEGQYATTGSNQFNGSQSISGSVVVSQSINVPVVNTPLVQNGSQYLIQDTNTGITAIQNGANTWGFYPGGQFFPAGLIGGSTFGATSVDVTQNVLLLKSLYYGAQIITAPDGVTTQTWSFKTDGNLELPTGKYITGSLFGTSSYASNAGLFNGLSSTIFATTGSNNFTGPQNITDTSNAISFTSTASLYTDGGLRVAKDSFVSGTAYFNNITVYGTSSIEYITSSQVNIGTNIIYVNTDTPAVRFGGLAVFDSGSTQLTGSMLWDSEKNHWVYSNPSGSSYSGGMIMSGPRSSALGDEQGTLNNYVMKGQGGDHITSSQIIDDGTTVRIPGNLQVTGSIVGLGNNTFGSSISSTQQITGSFSSTGSFTVNSSSFFIGSNNQVGINTTTPSSQLVVAKAGNSASVEINLNDSGYGRIFAYNRSTTAGANLVLNDPGGNVLVGTTADGGFKLDVSGTLRATGAATFASSVTTTQLIASAASNVSAIIAGVFSGTNNPRFFVQGDESTNTVKLIAGSSTGSDNMAFGVGGATNNIFIKAGGNVGIGTISPLQLLYIQGAPIANNVFSGIGIGDANSERIRIGYNTLGIISGLVPPQIIAGVSNLFLATRDIAGGDIVFQTGAGVTEKMRITGGGNIGIGVTPSAWASPFTVIQGGAYGQHIGFQSNGPDIKVGSNNYYNGSGYIYTITGNGAMQFNVGGNSGFQFNTAPSGTAGNAVTFTTAMSVTPGGNTLIGTTTDSGYKLNIYSENSPATIGLKTDSIYNSVFRDYTTTTTSFLDITTERTDGGGFNFLLVITSTLVASASFRSYYTLAVQGRGTSGNTTQLSYVSINTASRTAIAVSFPSNGVIRLTLTGGENCQIKVTTMGHGSI
jgi:hypothetical protein